MRLFLILSVLLAIPSSIVVSAQPQAPADAPRDGQFNSKARRARLRQALLDKNAPYSEADKELEDGRRARHACIPEFKRLCFGSSKKAMNAAGFDFGAGEFDFNFTDASYLPRSSKRRNFNQQKLKRAADAEASNQGNIVVPFSRERRMSQMRGLEQCLADHIYEIENQLCKGYIEGRVECFASAENVCRAAIESAAAEDSAARTKEQKDHEEKLKKKGAKDKAAGVLSLDALNALSGQVRSNQEKTRCLRENDKAKFSPKCTSSTFYKAMSMYSATGRGKGGKQNNGQLPAFP